MLATSAVMWCGASPTASSSEGCRALRGVVLLVDMAEIAGGRDLIPHHLLQLFDLGKTPVLAPRPQQLAIDPDLEHPARVVGNERDGAELLGESREQLLTHPGGAQQPIAEPAIGNGNVRSWRDGDILSCRGWMNSSQSSPRAPCPSRFLKRDEIGKNRYRIRGNRGKFN